MPGKKINKEGQLEEVKKEETGFIEEFLDRCDPRINLTGSLMDDICRRILRLEYLVQKLIGNQTTIEKWQE